MLVAIGNVGGICEDGYQEKWGNTQHIMTLGIRRCSCRSWMLSGIPYSHAIAAIIERNDDPTHFKLVWAINVCKSIQVCNSAITN